MSVLYAICRESDGVVIKAGTMPTIEIMHLQCGEGEIAFETDGTVEANGRWRWNGAHFEQDALPPPTLDELKAARLKELSDYAAPRLNVWSEPTGGLQVDDVSTARINAWATQALICNMTSATFDLPYWIMNDNSHRTFTDANDFLAFAQAAAGYKTTAVLHNSALKQAINAAADEAALDAIDITAGWP